MAKRKSKAPSKDLKRKVTANRQVAAKVFKDLTSTFLVNRLFGKALTTKLADVAPFTFVVTIDIVPGIVVTSVNVNGVVAKDNDFTVKADKVICEVKALVSTFTFLLVIDAQGDPQTTTTFNVTCDGTPVYQEDQEIFITQSGRGGFSDSKAPLP